MIILIILNNIILITFINLIDFWTNTEILKLVIQKIDKEAQPQMMNQEC